MLPSSPTSSDSAPVFAPTLQALTPPPSESPPTSSAVPAILPAGATKTPSPPQAAELGAPSTQEAIDAQRAKMVLDQIKLQDPTLTKTILSHRFPLDVALGFKFLLQEFKLQQPATHEVQSEWGHPYFSLLLSTVKVSISIGPAEKKEKEVTISSLVVKLWGANGRRLDLAEMALKFLVHSQNQSKSISNTTGQVLFNIYNLLQHLSENPTTRTRMADFLAQSNPHYLSWHELLIRYFLALKIPYTEENLDFLRIQITTPQGSFPLITQCICELLGSTLLTKEMKTAVFTRLVHRASASKEIVGGVIALKSDFLYLISAINNWLTTTRKIVSRPATATLRENIVTENFQCFLDFSSEAVGFAYNIFNHLRVSQDASLRASTIGVLNVLNYVLTKKLDPLHQVVEWLLAAAGETNSNAILTSLCEQPNLADGLECISTLLPNTKAKLKEAFLRDRTAFQNRLSAIIAFNTLFHESYVPPLMESSEIDPITSEVMECVESQLCVHEKPMDFIADLKSYLGMPEIAALLPAARWSSRCADTLMPPNPIWKEKTSLKKTTASAQTALTLQSAEVTLQGFLQPAGLDTPENNAIAKSHSNLPQLTNAVAMLASYGQLDQERFEQVIKADDPIVEAGFILLVREKMRKRFNDQFKSKDPTVAQHLRNAILTLLNPHYSDALGLTFEDRKDLLERGICTRNWDIMNMLERLLPMRKATETALETPSQADWGLHLMRDDNHSELLEVLEKLQTSSLSIQLQLQIMERIITRSNKEEQPLRIGIQFLIDRISDRPDNPMPAGTGVKGKEKLLRELFKLLIELYTQTRKSLAQKMIDPLMNLLQQQRKQVLRSRYATMQLICNTAGLNQPELLDRLSSHKDAIRVIDAVYVLLQTDLLYEPPPTVSSSVQTSLRWGYIKFLLYMGKKSDGHNRLMESIPSWYRDQLINETMLNFLVEYAGVRPKNIRLHTAISLINNFYQCKIPLTEANLKFSRQCIKNTKKEIATLCNQLSYFQQLSVEKFEQLTDPNYARSLSFCIEKLRLATHSPPPTLKREPLLAIINFPPEKLIRAVAVLNRLEKIKFLKPPLLERMMRSDHALFDAIFPLLETDDDDFRWTVGIIQHSPNPCQFASALHMLLLEQIHRKKEWRQILLALQTHPAPESLSKQIVVIFICEEGGGRHVSVAPLLAHLFLLTGGQQPANCEALEILYPLRQWLKTRLRIRDLKQLLAHPTPTLAAQVLTFVLRSITQSDAKRNVTVKKIVQHEHLAQVYSSMQKISAMQRRDPQDEQPPPFAELYPLLLNHSKPENLATVFMKHIQEHSSQSIDQILTVCKHDAQEKDPLNPTKKRRRPRLRKTTSWNTDSSSTFDSDADSKLMASDFDSMASDSDSENSDFDSMVPDSDSESSDFDAMASDSESLESESEPMESELDLTASDSDPMGMGNTSTDDEEGSTTEEEIDKGFRPGLFYDSASRAKRRRLDTAKEKPSDRSPAQGYSTTEGGEEDDDSDSTVADEPRPAFLDHHN